jgi:quercetin dioxygenase-like cupin family protein
MTSSPLRLFYLSWFYRYTASRRARGVPFEIKDFHSVRPLYFLRVHITETRTPPPAVAMTEAKRQRMNVSSEENGSVEQKAALQPLVITPDAGRPYPMGRLSAIFKADLEETNSALSVSEWWLEPNTEGPPKHKHPKTHLFYVIEGTLAIYIENKGWFEAEKGSYVFIPPGDTEHGFENRSKEGKAGFMSINTPGGSDYELFRKESSWRCSEGSQ